MAWIVLVTSLSGNHGALRLRFWRGVKALGAAVLRDGVYLAPARDHTRRVFEGQAAEIVASGGSAFVLDVPVVPDQNDVPIAALFDRTARYEKLIASANDFAQEVAALSEVEARRALRQLNREFALVEITDFFPGRARDLAAVSLVEAEETLARTFSPEEPSAVHAPIPLHAAGDYRGRTWATRARMWVDRIASAWLIRRFVDQRASFVWLERAADCPDWAVGFDFDGAEFSHVDEFVTFEVLLRSFELDGDEGLQRIAALVHQLDVGGGRVAEAAGFEAILTGARERCASDDALLDDMSRTLDDLYHAFSKASIKARKEGL